MMHSKIKFNETKKILFLIIIITGILSNVSLSQTQGKSKELNQLRARIEKLEKANAKLSGGLSATNYNIQKIEKEIVVTLNSLETLKNDLAKTNKDLQEISDNLDVKIQQTNEKTAVEISGLNAKISKSTLYWAMGASLTILLLALLFGWFKKQLSREKISLLDQIRKISENLREEQIKLDEQLIKLLDTQIQLMSTKRHSSSDRIEETDHSLALKVADEIIRIKKNLSNMDPGTKGLKQLLASVERIQDNFKANGYEIIDLLYKPYDEGMKLSATFRLDENLKPGEQIITRIIKPQVNYKGVMIQSAQVEVSVGESRNT